MQQIQITETQSRPYIFQMPTISSDGQYFVEFYIKKN